MGFLRNGADSISGRGPIKPPSVQIGIANTQIDGKREVASDVVDLLDPVGEDVLAEFFLVGEVDDHG
jgi:hypothetical protein